MQNDLNDLKEQRGFSAVEMLVVLLIIAIVATLAMMQMSTSDTQFRRQNVARELKVAFERARFDSVKRNAGGAGPSSVTVDASSYTLTTDSNSDGTYETLVTNFGSQNVAIAGYVWMTLPVTVTFDRRGEVTTTGGVDPQFLVCNGACGTPDASNANIVLVTRTGTVNLLGGNATPPTFNSPGVTSVSNTAGISNMVSLP